MSFLFKILFGWPSYGEPGSMGNMAFCITITSVLQIVLTVVGGSRSIKWFETVACTLLIFLTVYETIAILRTYDLSQIVTWRPPENLGSGLTFGTAMDAMAAFSLGWVPLVADFTRYTKNKSAAVIAPMIGANIALFWFALVGVLGVIATTLASGAFDPNKSDPSSVAAALGLGWVAFGVLILSTVTTNVVDIYSAGMSVSTVLPKIKPFTGLWIAAIIAFVVSYIPLFVGSFLGAFILFLDYIGFIFAPILGILIVDYYLIRKRQYDWNHATTVNGPYWYSNGVNWKGVGAWVVGIVIFLIVKNTDFLMNTTGAIYPTLFLSAIVYWFIAKGSVVAVPKVAVPKAAEKTTGA
jgi:NCS1 family nucleobase:cation symporter-1